MKALVQLPKVPKKYRLGVMVAGALILAGVGYAVARYRPASLPWQPAATAADPCAQNSEDNRYDCYTNHFVGMVKQAGADRALARLDALSQADAYVLAQCHPLIHEIGRAAYERYGSVTEAAKYASELCWSGYYHGVMESYMSTFDDAKLISMMPTICQPDAAKPYSFDYYNCLHGLGHGVTIRFDNDVFKALPFCDAIGPDWEQQSCYSGVFMQNIVVDQKIHKSVNLKADDPVYPCNAVTARYKPPCYLMVTSNILKVVQYDYTKAFGICDGVEADFVRTCYASMGRDISGNSLLDPAKVTELCRLGRRDLQANCYVGAVKNAVFNDRNTVKASQLCEAVEPRFREACTAARDEAASTI
ncbi:hypothetical protein KY386_02470 [Candidatus Parcubacteria bacterium]|nr:hypothetical protein [Candidatus Parcubacteria bacterium]